MKHLLICDFSIVHFFLNLRFWFDAGLRIIAFIVSESPDCFSQVIILSLKLYNIVKSARYNFQQPEVTIRQSVYNHVQQEKHQILTSKHFLGECFA